WLKVYEIPQGSRGSRGRPMVNILPLGEDERVTAILPVDLEALQQRAGSEDEIEDNDGVTIEGELVEADVEAGDDAEVDSDDDNDLPTGEYIFMATAKGTVKKTPLVQFSRPRSNGLIALRLEEGDTLISAAITDGAREVMLFSDGGKVLRFKEKHVRPMGRTARGVRGMKLPEGQRLVSMIIPQPGVQILSASERGYGKRTLLDEYPRRGRGGQGVIAMVINERDGKRVGALQVVEGDEMMLISSQGTLVRTGIIEVSITGGNTQGVRLIKLADEEALVGVERVEEPSVEPGDDADVEGAVDAADDDFDVRDDGADVESGDAGEPSED